MISNTSSMSSSTPAVLVFLLQAALLLWLICSASSNASAQPSMNLSGDDVALPDMGQVTFYLVTVDVGNHIWDNFGHTALRMVDEANKTDLLFNWGLFDTTGGYVTFTANFLRGVMDYRLGVAPPAWELGRYRQEERSVWQDRINLTAEQKAILYRRLAWNLLPENIVYDYDYFFDNCTTRVRDYLDEALGGSIASSSGALTPVTFRDEVLRHYANLPGIDLSLDVVMNSDVDRRMSQWEHMFLPSQLRNQLLKTSSSVYVNGQRLPLLSDSLQLMEFESPAPGPDIYVLVALLLIPLFLIVLCLRRNSIASFNSAPGYTLRAPHLSYRVLGLIGLAVSLCAGVYGLVMVLGWIFSTHQLLHHNINLLLFWPTDLAGIVLALRWFLKGGAKPMRTGAAQLLRLYLAAHLLAAFVYLIISLAGLTAQDTAPLMLYAVPVLIVFIVLVGVAGVRPVRSIRFN